MNETEQPATTVRELGLKLNGFERLVDEKFNNLTATIDRLAKALEESNLNKADQKYVDELKRDADETHERIFEQITALKVQIDKKPWLLIVLSSTFMAVFTSLVWYTVSNLISNK